MLGAQSESFSSRRAVRLLSCGRFQLELGRRTLVMGILNVTPDSFSDGGRYTDPERALERALEMVEEGADIIDIGGESTRPGALPVSAEEELRRIMPVLDRIATEVGVPVSIDTYKAEVARQAVAAGASIVNDVWGLQNDPQMAATVAELGVPVILMHNQKGTDYADDLMVAIKGFLQKSISIGEATGIPRDRMIIDPGFGFGKTAEHNLEMMARLHQLKELGLPILLGPSRKSTIGKVLDLPVDQRVEGTAALVALGIASGVDIIRVHDVQAMVRVARMTDAVVRPGFLAWEVAYIGLGSNMGDRIRNLNEALGRLRSASGIRVSRVSSVYETEPVGVSDQPWFLNMVVEVRTTYSPEGLLLLCQSIERDMGREASSHLQPRTIDLDLLLYGQISLERPGIMVPHPRIADRAFVLIPLSEIAPEARLPSGETVASLLERRLLSREFSSPRVICLGGRGVGI